jgi:hypothetical protein
VKLILAAEIREITANGLGFGDVAVFNNCQHVTDAEFINKCSAHFFFNSVYHVSNLAIYFVRI